MNVHDTHRDTIAIDWIAASGPGVLSGRLAPDEHVYPPAGFHRHKIPSIEAERTPVFRNWSRVNGMRRAAHVLVLDHDTTLLDILGQLLDGEGYNATLACQALLMADIQRLRPDVVIADASIARNGGESSILAHALRNTLTRDTTLFLTTSSTDVAQATSRRGFRTLLKPFDLDEVLELIAHATR